ncbi:hypothetical protein LZ31DRAFT_371405 [Colletotrichum somersetense]|nr:hypothetical protein LZ31DRAFT_371405 [Colletotrichum somersetense]
MSTTKAADGIGTPIESFGCGVVASRARRTPVSWARRRRLLYAPYRLQSRSPPPRRPSLEESTRQIWITLPLKWEPGRLLNQIENRCFICSASWTAIGLRRRFLSGLRADNRCGIVVPSSNDAPCRPRRSLR